jgi:hypothetical protein
MVPLPIAELIVSGRLRQLAQETPLELLPDVAMLDDCQRD